MVTVTALLNIINAYHNLVTHHHICWLWLQVYSLVVLHASV